jgi:hypothetical protein
MISSEFCPIRVVLWSCYAVLRIRSGIEQDPGQNPTNLSAQYEPDPGPTY